MADWRTCSIPLRSVAFGPFPVFGLVNPLAGNWQAVRQYPAVRASALFRHQSAAGWKQSSALGKPCFGALPGLDGSRLAYAPTIAGGRAGRKFPSRDFRTLPLLGGEGPTKVHPPSPMMKSAGCGHVVLLESTLQSKHEFFQADPMFVQKSLLAEPMVRIQIFPVMPRAKRDCRKVRRLLSQSPGSQDVRMRRFDNSRPAAHSRTDCASQRSNPSQILRASVRTPPRP